MGGKEIRRTIEQVEGIWPPPDRDATRLMRRVSELRCAPISELEVEDLRLLVGQRVGLPVILTRVLEELERNPLASGDMYPGDLLVNVLRKAGPDLDPSQRRRLRAVAERAQRNDAEATPAEVSELLRLL